MVVECVCAIMGFFFPSCSHDDKRDPGGGPDISSPWTKSRRHQPHHPSPCLVRSSASPVVNAGFGKLLVAGLRISK
jgi:hypothetical protein